MKSIALIPARGGSKRIPRKNIKPFHGRPIIEWTIEHALKSQCFEFVLVSTDDPQIANIAENAGAKVPFLRPEQLANDYATTVDVVHHAIKWVTESKINITNLCCVYPTSVFVTAEYYQTAFDLIKSNPNKFVYSVTPFSYPIQRALIKDSSGLIKMKEASFLNSRTQDLEPYYHDAGQFYWGSCDNWLTCRSPLAEPALPLMMPSDAVRDVDNLSDWQIAEILFSKLKATKGQE